MRQRYTASIQRAKGLLELAAALYDTSLSTRTTRSAENVLQTESRVGSAITLALRPSTGADDISLAFAADGFRELGALIDGAVSLVWINPSVAATMAYRGTGPFRKRLPVRLIATFPSWDVMGFAVHESTGIRSLTEIRKRRVPLRLSTGRTTRQALGGDPTMFTVSAVMRAAGFTFADIRKWGGKIQSVSRPSHPDRRAAIESGAVDAVFDEGLKSWGQTVLDHGFRYLPLESAVLKRLAAMGFRPAVVPKSRFRGLAEDVPTVDFSGWPMVVRSDMPDQVAHALCEAIEGRRDLIPTDNYKPLQVAQLCANDAEAPFDVPLHPGAERFYRERGYLR